MVSNFYSDMVKAKKGEQIVLNVLQHTTDEYVFDDVSNLVDYRYRGDIRALDDCWGLDEYCIDVKMDSCIGRTGNILCEEKVYFYDNGWAKGNMQSDYDALAIISVDKQKIYIIDFPKLKKHYKEGYEYSKDHGEQITYGYLFPLSKAWKYDMVKAIITYEKRKDGYYPVKVDK